MLFLIASTFSIIFIFCEIGERFKNSFDQINDEFDKLNWYLFPMDAMKMLSTIMIFTQKPVALNGFGGTQYNREQFKKVIVYIRFVEHLNNLHATNDLQECVILSFFS